MAVWLHSVAWRATRSTRAIDALALVQLALLEHRVQRLVVAEPHDLGDARAAVAVGALDHADVGDLAAAGGVERRVGELDEHAAVRALDARRPSSPARSSRSRRSAS